jgi:hypothetical protein
MLAVVLCLIASLPLALQNYGITSFLSQSVPDQHMYKNTESLLKFNDPSRINMIGTVNSVVNYIV